MRTLFPKIPAQLETPKTSKSLGDLLTEIFRWVPLEFSNFKDKDVYHIPSTEFLQNSAYYFRIDFLKVPRFSLNGPRSRYALARSDGKHS